VNSIFAERHRRISIHIYRSRTLVLSILFDAGSLKASQSLGLAVAHSSNTTRVNVGSETRRRRRKTADAYAHVTGRRCFAAYYTDFETYCLFSAVGLRRGSVIESVDITFLFQRRCCNLSPDSNLLLLTPVLLLLCISLPILSVTLASKFYIFFFFGFHVIDFFLTKAKQQFVETVLFFRCTLLIQYNVYVAIRTAFHTIPVTHVAF